MTFRPFRDHRRERLGWPATGFDCYISDDLERWNGPIAAFRPAMGIAESVSGTITGPWIQHDRPLWSSNGGHGMILRTSKGQDYLVFHWPNNTPDERVKLTEVEIKGTRIRILS
ncbi:hypothetical protein QFZ60_002184 [Arthrobacter sp. B2I5]|uniref:hypothetical protein n=1 Tax=Arthrobacter sp. B2I5 TaxID=3042266 RepID=UPI00277F40F4|nr:hypothetical protein [Arthrobacter sp. B2I5]MDQ0826011.1 hypothetical protein [Arthrobacter sp. B2I5]